MKSFKKQLAQYKKDQFRTMEKDLKDLILRYRTAEAYKRACRHEEVEPSSFAIEALSLYEASYFENETQAFMKSLNIGSLSLRQMSQVESLNRYVTHPWKKKVNLLAICAENLVGQFAEDSQIKLERISELYHGSSFDFKLNEIEFDCKARVSIGYRNDGSLQADRWDGVENIIFVSVSCKNYDSITVSGRVLGVFIPKLIYKYGMGDIIQGFSYFTPPFFADAQSYFSPVSENPRFKFNQDIADCLFELRAFTSLRKGLGGKAYFAYLAKMERGVYQELAQKLFKLHDQNVSYLSPLAILDFLFEHLEEKSTHLDGKYIQNVFLDCLKMSFVQRNYLVAILSLLKDLPNLRCKFTQRPLTVADIRFKEGIITAEIEGKKNTLLAYSRLGGELVSITSHEICDHPYCACLLSHQGHLKVGKASCPSYGVERDMRLRAAREGKEESLEALRPQD